MLWLYIIYILGYLVMLMICCHADDVGLMAFYIYALHRMCDVAVSYVSEYNIKLNSLNYPIINNIDDKNIMFNFDAVDLKAASKALS